MVSVITDIDSPRLRYVLDFLSDFFGEPFVRNGAGERRVVYGEDAGLAIRPSGFLSETGIRPFEPEIATHPAGFPVLFPDDGPLGSDLFSGIFYLLSRYEEYLRTERDSYGRFAHTASVAFRNGFLQRPLVHEWLAFFSEAVFGEKRRPPFSFAPTYDIDMAWSYRHKGLLRNAAGFLRGAEVSERAAVLLGRRRDPFDNFGFMNACHKQYGLWPTYFIHSGLVRTRYDKNIPLAHPAMRHLVKGLADRFPVGLHPSWHSGDDPTFLEKEKRALETVTGRPVTASRQHYIRMQLPATCRGLIGAGITDDHSMGYATINGFRASVAFPFYWYDLEAEQQTALRLHPFCFMDANARYEQGQDPVQTEAELMRYEEIFRTFGGTFSSVWHNTFLGNGRGFEGWATVWRSFLYRVTSAVRSSG